MHPQTHLLRSRARTNHPARASYIFLTCFCSSGFQPTRERATQPRPVHGEHTRTKSILCFRTNHVAIRTNRFISSSKTATDSPRRLRPFPYPPSTKTSSIRNSYTPGTVHETSVPAAKMYAPRTSSCRHSTPPGPSEQRTQLLRATRWDPTPSEEDASNP